MTTDLQSLTAAEMNQDRNLVVADRPLTREGDAAPLRVCHLITSLEAHGAQAVLLSVLRCISPQTAQSEVISLAEKGPLAEDLERLGIPVESLNMSRRFPSLWSLFRLIRKVRSRRTDLIVGWLYHANLIAAIVGKLTGVPVVWGIHHATAPSGSMRWRTRCVVRLCRALSRWAPAQTVYAGQAAFDEHIKRGFCAANATILPNGVDTSRFRPDPEARARLRAAQGIPPDAFTFGIIARFVPEKDHRSFVRAAGIVCRRDPAAHVVMCGEGASTNNRQLIDWIDEAGIASRVHLLGQRSDVASVLAGLDVLVSSSVSEAFSIVICEGLACALPCVVTDVGDSSLIVGDAGCVVPPSSPSVLAEAIDELRRLPRDELRQLGLAGRRRAVERFSDTAVAARYQEIWARCHSNGK